MLLIELTCITSILCFASRGYEVLKVNRRMKRKFTNLPFLQTTAFYDGNKGILHQGLCRLSCKTYFHKSRINGHKQAIHSQSNRSSSKNHRRNIELKNSVSSLAELSVRLTSLSPLRLENFLRQLEGGFCCNFVFWKRTKLNVFWCNKQKSLSHSDTSKCHQCRL